MIIKIFLIFYVVFLIFNHMYMRGINKMMFLTKKLLKKHKKEDMQKILKLIVLFEETKKWDERDIDLIDVCIALLLDMDNHQLQRVNREAKNQRKVF